MKGSLWRGVLYCFLWYMSILCGFIMLCCPMLPILLVNHKAYRHVMDLIFAMWELYPVALMEVLFGTKIVISGDAIYPWERSILVMNHRTRLDWNFLWGAMYYATTPPAHRLKFILKAPIRHTPGPGWVMQMAGFLYIHRRWENDHKLLGNMLDYLRDLGHTYQVLIFPEGTDFTKESILKSNKYADKNNLPHYSRVIHPKTTGFTFLTTKMRSNGHLDAIYDLSVGYPGTLPETEVDVAKGIFPEQVHFHIKRYPTEEVPVNEGDLKEWLCLLWKEKEDRLIEFYKTGNFTPGNNKKSRRAPMSNSLHLSILFWTSLILVTLYLLFFSRIVQIWTIVNFIIFITLSFASEGLQHVEAMWYRIKQTQIVKKIK
ncbi:hypothetical protein AAG570_003514 [Ranatra chinensis]|uniref:Phospholipid/glycerol acyltransferase domain-containing protein n=1 Tax=Ranatra chinensis TaxID=642074 RepID=A0ABD0YQL6_9HEMI